VPAGRGGPGRGGKRRRCGIGHGNGFRSGDAAAVGRSCGIWRSLDGGGRLSESTAPRGGQANSRRGPNLRQRAYPGILPGVLFRKPPLHAALWDGAAADGASGGPARAERVSRSGTIRTGGAKPALREQVQRAAVPPSVGAVMADHPAGICPTGLGWAAGRGGTHRLPGRRGRRAWVGSSPRASRVATAA
jgi:hypothetical protein